MHKDVGTAQCESHSQVYQKVGWFEKFAFHFPFLPQIAPSSYLARKSLPIAIVNVVDLKSTTQARVSQTRPVISVSNDHSTCSGYKEYIRHIGCATTRMKMSSL